MLHSFLGGLSFKFSIPHMSGDFQHIFGKGQPGQTDKNEWKGTFPWCGPHFFEQSILEVMLMCERTKRPQPVLDQVERPIPQQIYPVIDNDLARDNVENDLPAADLNELQRTEYFPH